MLILDLLSCFLLTVVESTTAIPNADRGNTNAARLAQGLGPAMPKPLERSINSRTKAELMQSSEKRAVCPSARPPFFPLHPVMDNVTTTTPGYGGYTELPFQAKLFNYASNRLFMTEEGILSLNGAASEGGHFALPTDEKAPYSVFAYWAWYQWYEGSGQLTYQVWPDAVAVRYQGLLPSTYPVYHYSNIDYTVYYSTQTPNWWYIYYDSVEGDGADGSYATIGAQGLGDFYTLPNQYVQYAFNVPGSIYTGLRLAFDTSCPNRYHTA